MSKKRLSNSIIQCLDYITHSVLPRNTFSTNRLHQQPPVLPVCSGHLSILLTLEGSGSICGLLGVQKENISTPEPKLPHTPTGHWWLYPGFLDIKWLFFCFVMFLRHGIDIAMNHKSCCGSSARLRCPLHLTLCQGAATHTHRLSPPLPPCGLLSTVCLHILKVRHT